MDPGNNSTNITYNRQEGMRDYFNILYKIVLTLTILDVIGIILCNMLVVMTIYTSASLRRQLRYLLVSSIAMGDLLLGLSALPFFIDFHLQKKVTVSCEYHVVIQILISYLHVMVTTLGLLLISLDYIKTQFNLRLPEITQSFILPVRIVITLLPWILMIIIIPPLISLGILKNIWKGNACPLHLYRWASKSLLAVCFYIPMVLITIATGLIIKGWVSARRRTIAFRPTLLNDEKPLVHPKYIVIVNVVCLCMLLPIHVLFSGLQYHLSNTKVLISIMFSSFELSILKGVILPCLWLYSPELRAEFLERCKRSYWRRSSESLRNVINKTYKEFRDEERKTEEC